jgi:hypothetical protein
MYKLSMLEQWGKQMGVLSSADSQDIWKAFRDFFALFLRNPEFRKYAQQISPHRVSCVNSIKIWSMAYIWVGKYNKYLIYQW